LAYTANAGEARSDGIELQTLFSITEDFRLSLGGSYVHARLTEDAPGLLPPGHAGDRLPGSPKVNANFGLQYALALIGNKALLRLDSIYVGPFFGELAQLPRSRSGDYVKLDASVRVQRTHWNADLFVSNLTNRDDFTFRGIGNTGEFFGYR